MLSASQKISSSQFKKYYKKGIKKNSEHFFVSLIYSHKDKQTQFAVVAPKKALKTAVLRNRNKRIIYEILRQYYPQFSHIDYGFIFLKKDISHIKKDEIKKELFKILQV